jgi:hypothetical protein
LTIQRHWRQYRDTTGDNTETLATIQRHWLQYRDPGYNTETLATIQRHWLQYTDTGYNQHSRHRKKTTHTKTKHTTENKERRTTRIPPKPGVDPGDGGG